MIAPRIVGYDDLHAYLSDEEDDAMTLAAEYADQGDTEQHDEQIGRAQAFAEVRAHIELQLRWPR